MHASLYKSRFFNRLLSILLAVFADFLSCFNLSFRMLALIILGNNVALAYDK